MIEFSNFSCSFNNREILKNINLKIKDHLVILGSNGSGKSTLVKSVCKLVKYEGNILLDGKNTETYEQKELAKKVVYIPTKLEIADEFISVEEFVLLGRFAHKRSFFDYTKEDRLLVEKNLEFLKLSHLKKHSVKSLSSGEQQLIQIAQALTQQSKTIIFDEPTANLDPRNTMLIASHIRELKNSHNILVITHDLEFASSLGIDVAFIKNASVKLHNKEIDFKEMVNEYD
ncbi:ABC transporter ATP-binding protein [Sulfurimonas lithotrophica]|uniref:ABC transporter ATP-binding protein n=1 Tax=Sulfurimonas lithotrophica TaxID=2590022 RepID=A0A5P8NY11_9BACT|nr:ABC transporter ATP-binding protein [Sulfurimonas lithotrophica]QFR48300.1 ABC transporter ATP-binding protein [Sulfurimonas lithotrophica]